MSEITSILNAVGPSDPQAAQLLPLVYDDLRRLAGHLLAHEAAGQTLQPTALVHEAYLRLVGAGAATAWDNRRHFFVACAEAMRRILVENVRRKRRLKRGGDRARLPLEEAELLAPEPREDVLALDETPAEFDCSGPDGKLFTRLPSGLHPSRGVGTSRCRGV
jgi:RNA polymerase sigma factor (TIGR02999 family)